MPRNALRPLTLVGFLGLTAVVIGAQAPVPKPADEKTASTVVQILERVHMAKPRIDDETGKKWCKNFLKDLDPQKYYFEKNDVTEFSAQATTLDDKIREGNLDFARLVFERYLKRNNAWQTFVMKELDEKPDFSKDDSILDDPDLYDYPVDNARCASYCSNTWPPRGVADQVRLPCRGREPQGEAHDNAIAGLSARP